ncbi:hypothetical protein G7B40_039935 [Aetokthonos hydrillicola Thurmond2011]|uniref:Uncharacterized protein n=1 Tax=Aetokthonos hydrillicola Thurmond2011 TaxID=2712845 RepID=A0AAP5MDJ5_9CYAN|nr:hypothetical protein [Aetokthonos hydrillicola]MBW4590107.1 hypothetical protein [Aetokthonos hydrillicola CCALA 1050]MDR9900662.1 hypothetical protein [Aetokthonos hydrillicola Thurmond2011]
MTSLTQILNGTTQVLVELTRKQAGKQLKPPVSERTVQKYLDLASLHLETFAHFRDEDVGGLNRYTKITNWHLPVLQRIRSYARTQGMKKLAIRLAEDPQYFLTGEATNDEQYNTDHGEGSGGKIQSTPTQAA